MFSNVAARFALRCALCGVAAANAYLLGALPGIDGAEALEAALTGIGGAFSYAGIGALLPQVEPSIGRKL